MAKRSGPARRRDDESLLTRAVDSVFTFIRFAEFEILFVLFFFIAFIIFKDLVVLRLTCIGLWTKICSRSHVCAKDTSRPEYNQILVKKPGGPDWWLS